MVWQTIALVECLFTAPSTLPSYTTRLLATSYGKMPRSDPWSLFIYAPFLRSHSSAPYRSLPGPVFLVVMRISYLITTPSNIIFRAPLLLWASWFLLGIMLITLTLHPRGWFKSAFWYVFFHVVVAVHPNICLRKEYLVRIVFSWFFPESTLSSDL